MYVNLANESLQVNTSKDSVVIVDAFATIRGGRSLDTTGIPASYPVLYAGHPIIRETATDVYKPMPLTGDPATAFAALPAGHTYIGILRASILTAKPFAAILTQGTVNPNATPFSSSSILAALKTALPLIDFRAD